MLELVKPRRTSVASDRPLLVPCGLEGFDYQIDPYIGCGHYCRYCYVLNQAETDWAEEILVYADIDGPYWSGVRAELEEVRSASAADLRIHV